MDYLMTLPMGTLIVIRTMWLGHARDDQIPPDAPWDIWLQMGGRGAGKTRSGAEWIRSLVRRGYRRVALVAATYNDAREVMIEGHSGLANIGYVPERPHYLSSRRRLEWPNGAVGYVFSGDDPDGLRGPQFEAAWADEFCAWEYANDTLSNLRLGTRLGSDPKITITSTPKNMPELRTLIKTPGVVISSAPTAANAHNLAPQFMAAMTASYGGTALARQELGGELLEDVDGALWKRAKLAKCRADEIPVLNKIIIAVDPPASHHAKSDACGIIVAGRAGEGTGARAYILFDGTVQGVPPDDWARRVVDLHDAHHADYVVVEVNQGGNLVEAVLENADPAVLIKPVYAGKSKTARAEPVSMLYEQGRVLHKQHFAALEDELCQMGTKSCRKSPDRADALVWAVTELLLDKQADPQMRIL